jgi:hypothetical protein
MSNNQSKSINSRPPAPRAARRARRKPDVHAQPVPRAPPHTPHNPTPPHNAQPNKPATPQPLNPTIHNPNNASNVKPNATRQTSHRTSARTTHHTTQQPHTATRHTRQPHSLHRTPPRRKTPQLCPTTPQATTPTPTRGALGTPDNPEPTTRHTARLEDNVRRVIRQLGVQRGLQVALKRALLTVGALVHRLV